MRKVEDTCESKHFEALRNEGYITTYQNYVTLLLAFTPYYMGDEELPKSGTRLLIYQME